MASAQAVQQATVYAASLMVTLLHSCSALQDQRRPRHTGRPYSLYRHLRMYSKTVLSVSRCIAPVQRQRRRGPEAEAT